MSDEANKSVEDQLTAIIDEQFKCAWCGKPTDRYITFWTARGIMDQFECIDCRQERVQKQVDQGLRPASDLLPENLPENRNPAR